MVPILLHKSKQNIKEIPRQLWILVPVGLFAATRIIFQMLAINLALVSYVISIKRTSVLFSIFFGYLVFKEKGVRGRLAGALLMLAGVLLITL
jgi:uncharacterized membrane protein